VSDALQALFAAAQAAAAASGLTGVAGLWTAHWRRRDLHLRADRNRRPRVYSVESMSRPVIHKGAARTAGGTRGT
jgi:hypothetical protein